ncbi:MAG TPA: DUF177 domain-containing protein [Terriglobales bacterium]|nr:DUF177 domain-containing protein [Terriglobales bacterium]
MFIEIHELERHPLEFDEEFRPGLIDFGADLRQRGDLHASGRAQLVEEHRGKHKLIKDIRLNGELSASLETACARCLEPVLQNVERQFDLLYRPQGVDGGQEERSFAGAEAEIGYYQGTSLLLEDVLREQVLLAVPLKAICRQDCKGLCPQCGADLNVVQCSCQAPIGDPRWSALKELRNKFEG